MMIVNRTTWFTVCTCYFNTVLALAVTGVDVHSVHLIIIMEICKAPTLRLKALNKHT